MFLKQVFIDKRYISRHMTEAIFSPREKKINLPSTRLSLSSQDWVQKFYKQN